MEEELEQEEEKEEGKHWLHSI